MEKWKKDAEQHEKINILFHYPIPFFLILIEEYDVRPAISIKWTRKKDSHGAVLFQSILLMRPSIAELNGCAKFCI